jgi:hypothetical protein
MIPKLAILIPYTPDRQKLYDRVTAQIKEQILHHPVIIIPYLTKHSKEGGPTTGEKRNWLLDRAREQNASHIAFVDSDDLVGPNYIERNMEGVYGDYDCNELYGRIYFHNKPENIFHHSNIYDKWFQDSKMYYRTVNHLNTVKLAHYDGVKFPNKSFGEDFWGSEGLRLTGRLVKQYPVKEVIYHYFTGRKNHVLEPRLLRMTGTSIS